MGLTPESASESVPEPTLDRLLEHPAIWRGRSAARITTLGTGWTRLDEALPGGGWPAAGLSEILTARSGLGELRLFIPLLVQLGRQTPARWVSWISPPFEPYAPALAAAGVPLERQLVVRTAEPAWAIEQALDSGGCSLVFGWLKTSISTPALRRLQLATQRSQTPAMLFRPLAEARQASPAELRITLEPCVGGARLQIIKSRGGDRRPLELSWSDESIDSRLCDNGLGDNGLGDNGVGHASS
jgi:cell division inhibitor SulA/protein ImuA